MLPLDEWIVLVTVEPLLTDTSLIRIQFTWCHENVHTFFVKNNLYNTDNGHEISAQREMTVLIQHDFLFVVTLHTF